MNSESMDVAVIEQFYEAAQDLYFERIESELAAAGPRVKRRFMGGEGRVSDLGGDNVPVVIGSSLVVFDEKLSEEERQAAADCQTYAETIVNRLPANTSPEQCYRIYNAALLSAGWYSEGFTYQDYVTKKLTVSMNEAVLEILDTVVGASSGNIVSLVAAGITKMKRDAKALKVVETGSQKNNTVSFKAIPCIAAPGGGVSMVLGGLDVVDKKFDGDFLFVSIKTAGVKMFRAAGVRKFNKRVFERKKDKIYDYIDRFTDDLITKLTSQ
jgi:hypothetical protein